MKLVITGREIYHECQRGELRAKGKIMFITGQKRKFQKPSELSHNVRFSLLASVLFERMGPNALEINNLVFPYFFLGRYCWG